MAAISQQFGVQGNFEDAGDFKEINIGFAEAQVDDFGDESISALVDDVAMLYCLPLPPVGNSTPP